MSDDNTQEEQISYYDSFISGTQYYVSSAFLPLVGGLTGYLASGHLGGNSYVRQGGAFAGIATGIYASSGTTYSDITRGAITGAVTYGATKLAGVKNPQIDKYASVLAGGATLIESKADILGTVSTVTSNTVDLVQDVKQYINNQSNMIILGALTSFILLYAYQYSKKNE